jgi:spore germination protein
MSPAIVAFGTYNNIFDYLGSLIAEKLVTGLSTIGYIWRLPYIDNVTRGQSMSYDSAIALARETGTEIQYDEVTKASYFQFVSEYENIVRIR